MEIFKILGTIALSGQDKFNDDIDSASGKGKKLSNILGKGLAAAAKVGAAAVGAAATAVGALMKSSIGNYAEYEQLVGGAQLMFGEAYDFIAEKAANAYKNVQMSQNEYLQQANGFATGLKTAMNGNEQAAAELADRIITAEADVVAATGNTQEAVQNAFNGIMKSNYTMLDNLQLGITPTKEGFQEVIDKVNDWNAANGRATDYQIDNLADAQKALVDYIDMVGIAGYAQAEAADTIQGSVASMKSAWQNFVTGLSDENADLGQLMDNLIGSAVAAGQNINTRLQVLLPRLTQGLTQLANNLIPMIPGIVSSTLPGIIQGAILLVNGVIGVLPQLISTITPVIAEAAPEIIMALATAIISNLPLIIESGIQVILALIQGIAQSLPTLVPIIFQVVWQIAQTLLANVGLILNAGGQLIVGLFLGLWNEFVAEAVQLGEWVQVNLITPIENKVAEFINVGTKVVDNIKEGIANAWNGLVSWFENLWNSLFNRHATISVGQNGATASPRASGLDYVPYNNFPAMLHEGEAVLTASEADAWRKGNGGGSGKGVTIIQNITAVAQTPVQLASATAAYFEQARWAL